MKLVKFLPKEIIMKTKMLKRLKKKFIMLVFEVLFASYTLHLYRFYNNRI